VISNFRKTQIIEELKSRNVCSIDPLIIDPIFTYVDINSIVNYNSTNTTKSPEQLFGSVSDAIETFETTYLSRFENNFLQSRLTAAIDNSDTSILSNDTKIKFEKRFSPIYSSTLSYKLRFNTELYNPYSGYLGCVSSTGFKLANTGNNTCYIDDDGMGKIRIYYLSNNTKFYINNDAGTVDYFTGLIILNSFNFSELSLLVTEFRVSVESATSTYTPVRNEILLLSFPKIQINDLSVDNVVYSGIVDVLGNTSPLQTNSVLNTVVI
jgi:hypothetical protein